MDEVIKPYSLYAAIVELKVDIQRRYDKFLDSLKRTNDWPLGLVHKIAFCLLAISCESVLAQSTPNPHFTIGKMKVAIGERWVDVEKSLADVRNKKLKVTFRRKCGEGDAEVLHLADLGTYEGKFVYLFKGAVSGWIVSRSLARDSRKEPIEVLFDTIEEVYGKKKIQGEIEFSDSDTSNHSLRSYGYIRKLTIWSEGKGIVVSESAGTAPNPERSGRLSFGDIQVSYTIGKNYCTEQ